ncbi:MAG: S8 family peptidase [Lachnospiraceae bacterium]|nr:S8 family peptidase [Lachnospiraceae bacterium]
MIVTPSHVAGIIAGDGTMSDGRIRGVAPGAALVPVRVLDPRGNGKLASMLEGIEWILSVQKKLEIRIVNISAGATWKQGENSRLVLAVNALWDAGMIVCTAAGNEGDGKTNITSPGVSRKTITVGSCDDGLMIDEHGRKFENYSGRGPTLSCICKPEVIAPGTNIISVNSMRRRSDPPYSVKSGTSMSTPIVSGAIALLLEKYPAMTNRDVKLRIRERAVDMKLSFCHQGWGRLSIPALLSEKWKENP